MDAVQRARLRQALLQIQSATNAALAELAADMPDSKTGVMLPGGVTACRHPRRTAAMGGYWSCPDCGAQGREEAT